jgi:hypothetical protein
MQPPTGLDVAARDRERRLPPAGTPRRRPSPRHLQSWIQCFQCIAAPFAGRGTAAHRPPGQTSELLPTPRPPRQRVCAGGVLRALARRDRFVERSRDRAPFGRGFRLFKRLRRLFRAIDKRPDRRFAPSPARRGRWPAIARRETGILPDALRLAGRGVARCFDAFELARLAALTLIVKFLLVTPRSSGFARDLPHSEGKAAVVAVEVAHDPHDEGNRLQVLGRHCAKGDTQRLAQPARLQRGVILRRRGPAAGEDVFHQRAHALLRPPMR